MKACKMNNFNSIGSLFSPFSNERFLILNNLENKQMDESVLQVSTFRRKRTKLKREKRKQRRKKMRNLSWKKKEAKNY